MKNDPSTLVCFKRDPRGHFGVKNYLFRVNDLFRIKKIKQNRSSTIYLTEIFFLLLVQVEFFAL